MSALAMPSGGLVLDRPFTRADAYASGLTDRDLRSDRFVRVFRGVYLNRATTRTAAIRAQAALRIAPPSALVSHHSAAVIWGGAVPPQSVVHITVPKGQDCQVDGIRTHRYLDMPPPSWHVGVRVTSPERTMCDLARTLDLVELVVLGDRFVRRDVTTPLRLIQAADEWHGPRRRLVQRASRLVRRGVDSPPESRLRMLVVLAGLPEPTVNHIIRNETGEWLRRFELAYIELLLAIEYQGRWHRESDEVWEGDIERREELDHRTWRVVEVISKSLNDDPFRVLQRIELVRRDRGARPILRFSEEWRAFFPGTHAARQQRRT